VVVVEVVVVVVVVVVHGVVALEKINNLNYEKNR
jgi:hypothetical protein